MFFSASHPICTDIHVIDNGISDHSQLQWKSQLSRPPLVFRSIIYSDSKLNSRKYFFSRRVVDFWNSLPADIVSLSSFPSFKRSLDGQWFLVIFFALVFALCVCSLLGICFDPCLLLFCSVSLLLLLLP